jgi:predicted DNA-binding transcriptional regulator YafY
MTPKGLKPSSKPKKRTDRRMVRILILARELGGGEVNILEYAMRFKISVRQAERDLKALFYAEYAIQVTGPHTRRLLKGSL